MFVAAINILTLISFTVHAVMGCCVHHHHHLHTTGCHSSKSESAGENSDSHDSSCEVKEVAAESCAHGCCHDGSGSKNLGSDTDVFVGGEHDSLFQDSPCNDSHDCDEPSCNFVVATPQTSVDIKAISTWVVFHGSNLTASEFQAIARSCKRPWSRLSAPPVSFQCACALLQTWQI